MLIAVLASAADGWLSPEDVKRVKNLLLEAQLPLQVTGMTPADFFELMKVDKKIVSGSIRYVLLKHIGEAFVCDSIDSALVEKSIVACIGT